MTPSSAKVRTASTLSFTLVCLLLVPEALIGQNQTENKNTRLRWKAVPHAGAYAVEVEGADFEFTQKVDIPFIEIHLLPGMYRFRLATIDAHGVQGEWSPWREISVKDDKDQAGPVRAFTVFVPGLSEYNAGQPYRAAAMAGSVVLGALVALDSQRKAHAAAVSAKSDGSYRLYNEPVWILAAGFAPEFDAVAFPLLGVGYRDYERRRQEYDRYRRQGILGGIIFLLGYAWHFSDIRGASTDAGNTDAAFRVSLEGVGDHQESDVRFTLSFRL